MVGGWLDQVEAWDHALLRKVNGEWTAPWADQWFSLSADFGLLFWPLLVGVVLLVIFGGFRERLALVLMAVALLVGDAGLNQWIKWTVNRPRPFQVLEGVRYVKQEGLFKVSVVLSKPEGGPVRRGRSMTSGHVCNNVAAGVIITAVYAPWGWVIWPWVLSMSYARVYTGAHFPTDVAASWLLALAYTLAILWAAQAIWQRWGRRWLPESYARHPDLFPAFVRIQGVRDRKLGESP